MHYSYNYSQHPYKDYSVYKSIVKSILIDAVCGGLGLVSFILEVKKKCVGDRKK